jgi:hypothetical protein
MTQRYCVTVSGTVTKQILVDADNEDSAQELAHNTFSYSNSVKDSGMVSALYQQKVLNVEPI